MGRGFLSPSEIETLRRNPYVKDVNERRISYTGEFKHLFIEKYLQGERPTEIFRRAGFDVEALGSKRIERACARWKESYKSGTLGMYDAILQASDEPRDYKTPEILPEAVVNNVEKVKTSYIETCHKQARQIKALQEENENLKAMFCKIAEEHSDVINDKEFKRLVKQAKSIAG